MKYKLLFVLLFASEMLSGQSVIKDDFTDGNHTSNPNWFGNTTTWAVNDDLQLQTLKSVQSQTVYLSTPAEISGNIAWSFSILLPFDPSVTNQLRIYLMSDRQDLTGPLNGYFLQIGEAGSSDSYDLYRQTGTGITRIVDAAERPRQDLNLVQAAIKVMRSKDGLWVLETRIDQETVFIVEGSAIDKNHSSGNYFGLRAAYSPTRSDKFFFDDLLIEWTAGEIVVPEKPCQAKPGDLLFTEFFPDPTPKVGLPEAEFVELYNTTDEIIQLKDYSYSDAATSYKLKGGLILPKSYLILCANADTLDFKPYGTVLGLGSWPSLNNGSDALTLKNADGEVVDQVSYSDTWHRDATKKAGGYSLERIAGSTCVGAGSWRSSVALDGGTPGKVNSVAPEDDLVPALLSLKILDERQLALTFNKSLDSLSLASIEHYAGLLLERLAVNGLCDQVVLTIAEPLEKGKDYVLLMQGIKDCRGVILDEMYSFRMPADIIPEKPYQAKPGDLLFTEFFPDPTPKVGLPEAEFVELYNTTDEIIQLKDYSYSDAATSYKLKGGLILPKSYLILCANADTLDFKPYGTVLGLGSWPSLNNGSDALTLKNADGEVVDQVSYSDTWYRDATKKAGGYSLERIAGSTCVGAGSWRSSVALDGGTPGNVNSVAPEDILNPIVLEMKALDKQRLELHFNKPMDSLSLTLPLNYAFKSGDIQVLEARTAGPFFNTVELILNKEMAEGMMYLLDLIGTQDCRGEGVANDSKRLSVYQPHSIQPGEILINELLFNPYSDGVDFVEIINTSQKTFDLRGLQIGGMDAKGIATYLTITDLERLIAPGQLLALSVDPLLLERNYHCPDPLSLMRLRKMPAYNVDAGTVLIGTVAGQLIDRFDYAQGMHFELIKNPKGVSLERVRTDRPTNEPGNFRSAASTVGYATPGYANSQAMDNLRINEEAVRLSSRLISPDNDGKDDYLQMDYRFESPDLTATVIVSNRDGVIIRRLLQNALLGQNGVIYWDGLDDHGNPARIGPHVIRFDVLDQTGKAQQIRKYVAVVGLLP